jgi:hypothetical protein
VARRETPQWASSTRVSRLAIVGAAAVTVTFGWSAPQSLSGSREHPPLLDSTSAHAINLAESRIIG